MQELQLHPVTAKFREMTANEYSSLKADIKNHGLKLPLFVFNNQIIDGRHRYKACLELGIEPLIMEYTGDESGIESFVDSVNEKRRHLSRSERAIKALEDLSRYEAEAALREKAGVKIDSSAVDAPRSGKAAELLAQDVGVPTRYIEAAKSLQQKKPELFEQVKRGEISITEAIKPRSTYNTGAFEWYTPENIILLVREVLGEIDCDPASNEIANQTVKAKKFYTIEDDGLKQKWGERVFMNPPFANKLIVQFCVKLVFKISSGEVEEAIIIANNGTDTEWGQLLLGNADAFCFPKGRVNFLPEGKLIKGNALQGQMICYFGNKKFEFAKVFGSIGYVGQPIDMAA